MALEFQEFPAEMVPERKAEGWEVAGPCRPYGMIGYSVWMKRIIHCCEGDCAQPLPTPPPARTET